jgi:hypothetical protein
MGTISLNKRELQRLAALPQGGRLAGEHVSPAERRLQNNRKLFVYIN